jgi:Flp pilus assembly protein CpaB
MPPTATTAVLVAAADLPGGRRLAPGDVTEVQLPVDAVPGGAVSRSTSITGRTLAAPVTRGEPITDVRLVSPGLLDGYPGLVAAPVRIADPAAVRLLAVGDHVDLLAVSPEGGDAVLVAPSAPVLTVPVPSDADGIVGGALVVVAVPEEEAHALAEASVRAVLTLVLNR